MCLIRALVAVPKAFVSEITNHYMVPSLSLSPVLCPYFHIVCVYGCLSAILRDRGYTWRRCHRTTNAVIPRPVAFVSTQAVDGTVNLSPFSYFNTVGHEPPMLAVSICRNHDGGKKDTLVNIEASG